MAESARWPSQVAAARKTIEVAVKAGAGSVYITTSGRGGLGRRDAEDAFTAVVLELKLHADSAGLPLLLEPNGIGIRLDILGCAADSSFGEQLQSPPR